MGSARGAAAESHARCLNIHLRFYVALALEELVRERPLAEVAEKYGCAKGMLQALQQSAATFAGEFFFFFFLLNLLWATSVNERNRLREVWAVFLPYLFTFRSDLTISPLNVLGIVARLFGGTLLEKAQIYTVWISMGIPGIRELVFEFQIIVQNCAKVVSKAIVLFGIRIHMSHSLQNHIKKCCQLWQS